VTASHVVERVEDAGVRLVRFLYCGNDGTIRAKASGRHGLEQRLESGIGLTVAMQAMNALDQLQPVEGLGPVGEVRLVPDVGTFRLLPYAPHSAAVLTDHVGLDGEPAPVCQRSFLKRMEARLADRGLVLRAAFENEFSLATVVDGAYVPVDRGLCFSTISLTASQEFADELVSALEAQDIMVEQYYAELGHGQQELSTGHAPALRIADDQVLVRETIRGVATRQGLIASLAGLVAGLGVASALKALLTGGMLESEAFYESLLRRGRRRARPSLLVAQQLNGPGDAVARDAGATGPVETVSSACSSGSMAIGAALRALRRGDVDLALAGASDSLCQLTHAGFNSLRAVDERPCRPFRKDRLGLSIGEGAGVLVLETLTHARARGARPIAILAGEAATCDAHHMTAPHPEGRGAFEAIEAALADAGVDRDEIDFVNAHGTGTPLNDLAEARAMRRVFGSRAASLPVTSTKALIGHLLGSAGAVEAVATVLGLARREVHPMPADGAPDEEIGLRLVLGAPLRLVRASAAVSTNLAFGGANAALVFRSVEAA